MPGTGTIKYIWRGHHDAGFFCNAMSWRPSPSPLIVAANNEPPEDEPYLCMVPILDYTNLSRVVTELRGTWHFSQLDDSIKADCRARRCIIVLDLCNEGPSYDKELFAEIVHWMTENHIPAGYVVWLAQNRAIRNDILNKSRNIPDIIDFVYYDFFIKCIFWKFSPWFQEPVLGRNENAAVAGMLPPLGPDKILLCLNATPRLARVLTIASLIYYGMDQCSLLSFPGLSYVKEGDGLSACLDFVDRNPFFSYLRPVITDIIPKLPPIFVDNFPEKGNDLFDKIDVRSYNRTSFSLVTESDMSNGDVVRITEKLAKSFCLGHPSVVVGNPYSLTLMEEFGFATWDPVVDGSYDRVVDPAERFAAAMRTTIKAAVLVSCNPAAWRAQVASTSEANIRTAVSGRALQKYIEHYDDPIIGHFAERLSGAHRKKAVPFDTLNHGRNS